jgi:hypothetical protein
MTADDPVALRIQGFGMDDQVLALLDLAWRRAGGRVAPSEVAELFEDLMLPDPGRVSNRLASLEKGKLAARARGKGAVWAPTPAGGRRVRDLLSAIDLVGLEAELMASGSSSFGHTSHPVITPILAPPAIVRPVLDFVERHPFDTNVFGMTRFPSEDDAEPLAEAIEAARAVCKAAGLTLHMASDGNLVDDVWANVTTYMWGCRYGIAFFEDLSGNGINHNMTIEVGGMLVTGRRCALLKDKTVEKMPTDLVGQIYKSVSIENPRSVAKAVGKWVGDDLRI